VALGLEQLAAGVLDETRLKSLVELARNNPRVRGLGPLFEGALETAQGRPETGLQLLRDFEPAEISRLPLLMTLGQALQAKGQSHEAARVYQEVLKHDERSLPARYALSDYWYQRGEITRAMFELEQITRLDPRQARAWTEMGQHSIDFGLLPQAERFLRSALAAEPEAKLRQEICLDLGQCLFQQRNFEEALEFLEQAQPGPATAAWRAEALAAMGRDEESRAALAEAQRLGPGDRTVRIATARLSLQWSQPREALAVLLAGVAENPQDRDFQFQLAQTYAALGETAEADAARERFAALDRLADRYSELNTEVGDRPDDVSLRLELAELAGKLGLVRQAESWRRAARLIEQERQVAPQR
jgi:tetratricopeptide (TPR) repeat protein